MQDHERQGGWSPQLETHDGAFAVPYLHRLRFTRHAFEPSNHTLVAALTAEHDDESLPVRAGVVIDAGVVQAWPSLQQQVETYFAAHDGQLQLAERPLVVAGGESAKNDWVVYESVTRLINEARICRQSAVVVIGGGAVLDAVGFAAATAHRGVRLVRLPTTTLSQGDSGVGVKNGLNVFGKKNFVGCFAPPWSVINDEAFLTTLSDRDWRSGMSEVVKVALLKSERFFRQIVEVVDLLARRDEAAAVPIIRQSAWQHMHHIVGGGDPFELRDAKPLDFGHWSAHKLEQMTNFQLRHGEAVAIGLALDVVYSAMTGRLEWSDVKLIHDCLGGLGFDISHDALADKATLFEGIEEFREHLGGRLSITMLNAIGHGEEIHEIDSAIMEQAVRWLEKTAAGVRRTARG